MKKKVVLGLLGVSLDMGTRENRWEKWRPTVSLCQHEDLIIDRYELLYQQRFNNLAKTVTKDIESISPETEVVHSLIEMRDPWDFEEVYGCLHDFARNYDFKDDEEYYVHITTGTHVAQICLFLLTESYHFPAKLIQSSPDKKKKNYAGTYTIIDLDLSRYDKLANRFLVEAVESQDLLKAGISTKDRKFNELIEQIEKVSMRSQAPILLTGPTGAGKSQLAQKIYELRKQKNKLQGNFVEVNCATLRGDAAMSTLFGHKKGSFTGASNDRAGLLKEAENGLLFLDEIGELGLDEQAMLLRALEDKTFLPLGSDTPVKSEFQLICGTNRKLHESVRNKTFRDDLLARINIWDFELPGLKDRAADIAPNIDHELQKFAALSGNLLRFTVESKKEYLNFATSAEAVWAGNFRDLNASIHRMSTLADTARISVDDVHAEISLLKKKWLHTGKEEQVFQLEEFLSEEQIAAIDPFDRPQLANVIRVCKESKSLSQAGRTLFSVSRLTKKVSNDSDRLRKYLAKFGLSWDGLNT
ncbi:MAG: RNA repair transcriptional activator RtcR [Lentisphaerales bacterium]|nr:RNA repair transcriptional activator RtcR [Lentisphaerales bacterium]